jgi:tetratricopeptide (TPR) repeat protein
MARKKQRKPRKPKRETRSISAIVHILLSLVVLIVTLAVYINTVHHPFQFDDLHRIKNNENIRSLPSLWDKYSFFKGRRSTVNLSLWMNYRLGEKEKDGSPTVEGMHILNVLFHALNGVLVYFVALSLIGGVVARRDDGKRSRAPDTGAFSSFIRLHTVPFLAMFSGLVFTLHPVQTESVTYIITRSEVLAAFFSLVALLLYISLVPSRSMLRFAIIIAGILVVYAFGLESKEWVPVLPLLMVLADYVLLSGGDGRRFLRRFEETGTVIVFMVLMTVFYLYNLSVSYKGDLDAGFGIRGITHRQYFLSQFNVLTYYVKLLVLPTSLRLDYDFPVVNSLAHFPTFLTLPFVVLMLGAAIITIRRSPMFSFAVLWFFIAIAPSAGIVPVSDLVFEHRLYMPMVGFSIFAVYLIWRVFQVRVLRDIHYLSYVLLIALVTVYGAATVNRNKVWSTEESLWEDSARKSPNKARPHSNLGLTYLRMYRRGDVSLEILDKAEKELAKATELDPELANAYHNLGLVYAAKAEAKLLSKKNLAKAREAYLRFIEMARAEVEEAEQRIRTEGKYDEALKRALEKEAAFYRNGLADAYHDLAVSHEYNDGGERYGEGFDLRRAIEAWDKALEYTPENTDRLWNKAIVLVNGGETGPGVEALRLWISKTNNESVAETFYSNGFAAFNKNDYRRARYYLETGLTLRPDHPMAGKAREVISGVMQNSND